MALTQKQLFFTEALLHWNQTENTRTMPWKGVRDPYCIWLSEIILQQTRVEQGLPYYQRLIAQFPTVFDLAAASEAEVMKLWQGLGYYSRARNMHHTAKKVAQEMNGKFPASYAALQALRGVGSYTAAAIASFAFHEPVAVVDGNVIRILSRFFGIATPFDTTEGKKEFALLAQQLASTKHIAAYNQAIMDFGAVICTPHQPACANCALAEKCWALRHKHTTLLPVRVKKMVKKKREMLFVIATNDNHIFLEQRTDSDIWKHLFQPPLIELPVLNSSAVQQIIAAYWGIKAIALQGEIQTYKQTLTHQQLVLHFATLQWNTEVERVFGKKFLRISLNEIGKYAFPKTIALHLQKIGVT